jgi:hypothetical protein
MRQIKNRKVRNREIERQKRSRNRLFAGIAILALLIVAAAVSWVVWDTQNRNWILRFEGQRIPTNEFRVFMGGDSPEARQDALNALVERLTLIHKAEEHGVGLTDDEKAFWAWLVEMQWGENHLVPMERMGEFTAAVMGEIWERLMDIYIPDMFVVIIEDQFAVELAEYLEANLDSYVQMDVLYVMIDDREEAEDARARLLAGEVDFYDIYREFTSWYEEGTDIDENAMPVQTFVEEAMLGPSEAEMLMALQTGEVSELIEWGADFGMESYLLIYAINREEPDEEEVARNYRERHILTERSTMLMTLVPQWIEQANYTVNTRALNLA